MGIGRRSGAQVAALCMFGIAAQSAQAQINTQPPPSPVPVPVYAPPPPPIAPPPGGISATPTGNPGEWVTAEDYPISALREERQGATAFRVTIGPDGLVTGCAVTVTSGSPDLDEATCRLVSERARFSPARNAKGEAVVGLYNNRIRWVLPTDEVPPQQLKPRSEVLSFFVETDGLVTGCEVIEDGKPLGATDPANPCMRAVRVAPITDVSGKPVRRKVTMANSITVTDPNAAPPPRAVAPKPAPRKRRGK